MSKIEFKRGDTITHTFIMPTSSWSPGGTLFFTAKPAVDDDLTDANAVINVSFSDSVAVNDGTNVTYTMTFLPAATAAIASNGETSIDYLGEFQYVNGTSVSTFPGNDKYIDVIVYFDIRRATT